MTAEKKNAAGKNVFQQICQPEGKADLFVDAPTRSFPLRNIKLLPKCKGVVGWVINFIAPLLRRPTRHDGLPDAGRPSVQRGIGRQRR